ncbi:HAAS signaling domain-containing protein [Oceanobacillus saliphilus]|uniref:HAAS signaling domain-containing protein n=1 Tax=Oceanobacillus saliphilus TaxID=2925834 RepID=UPI00201D7807|nr:DUF1700 domain-containing protein [Oceanobacillus saliphilus]
MTKDQFLSTLNTSLKRLSTEERHDILQDFEEHFAIGVGEGKTEEQISASLGSPHQIAKELVATYHVDKVETTATTSNMFRAVWAVIGLGFFNLIIVLGPFIALAAIILSGWIAGISFIVSPVIVMINTIIYPEVFNFYNLFFSIALAGLGLLITIGMYYVTRTVTRWFVRYLKFNVRFLKGGLKHV